MPGTPSSVDDTTKLSYAPDAAFTDAGTNSNISAEYVTPQLPKGFHDLRSFPDGERSCYTLRSRLLHVRQLRRPQQAAHL
jgi:hypothetical protein